jgi:hypothetical protein
LLLHGSLLQCPDLKKQSKWFTWALYELRVQCLWVIVSSSVTDLWPGSNWMFWSHSFLIVPNAAVVTDNFCLDFPHPADITLHVILQHNGSYYVNWYCNRNVSGQQTITFDATDVVCTYIIYDRLNYLL